MPSFARTALTVAASLFFAAAGGLLRADVLTLANGDKLKGTLVQNVDGMITFKSDILGEIIVATTKASVEVDLTEEQKAAQAAKAKAEEEKRLADARAVEERKKAEEKKKAEAAAVAVRQPEKKKRKPPAKPPAFIELRSLTNDPSRLTTVSAPVWYNRIAFGLVSQSGRTDKLDIKIDTENSRRTPKTDLRFTNLYTYSEANDLKSDNLFRSNLRFRRTITAGRLFAQSNTRYERNTIKNVSCDAEQGLGLGYNVLKRKKFNIAVGSDVAERYRLFVDETASAATNVPRFTTVFDVFQDLSLTLNPRFKLTQDAFAQMAVDNSDDYKVTFSTTLKGNITDFLDISTTIRLEYDNARIGDERYDQRISTSVGYVF